MVKITAEIRTKFPNIIVVWGGTHATICPEECIRHVDYVCIGEGELSFIEFVKNVQSSSNLDNINNFWIKKKADNTEIITKNKISNFLENLDEIPIFDYSSQNKYYIEDNKLFEGDPILNLSKYCIMVSRGCPFRCSFCSNSYFHQLFKDKGKFVRRRSIDHVFLELAYAKRTLKNMKVISFLDEVFVFDQQWVREFVREYKKKINLDFRCEFYPSLVDEEIVCLLKDAGLKEVTMGIQSGSERIRNEIFNRSTPDTQILRAAKIFKKYKITPHYDIILDNPYETWDDMQEGIKLLLQIPRPYNFHLYSLINFPKTDLTQKLIKDGFCNNHNAKKALSQWRMSLNSERNKEHLYHNCLVSLLSKRFIPKIAIEFLLKNKFLLKHPKIVIIVTSFANKSKLVFTGISMILTGKVSYNMFKHYLHDFKELIN